MDSTVVDTVLLMTKLLDCLYEILYTPPLESSSETAAAAITPSPDPTTSSPPKTWFKSVAEWNLPSTQKIDLKKPGPIQLARDDVWNHQRVQFAQADMEKSKPVQEPVLFLDAEGACLSRDGELTILQLYVNHPNHQHTYIIHVHRFKDHQNTDHQNTDHQNTGHQNTDHQNTDLQSTEHQSINIAFSTLSTDGSHSLKSILEDSEIAKVFFDVRKDSDALYGQFNITLAGVIDLQLMELSTRVKMHGGYADHVTSYARCLSHDAGLQGKDLIHINEVKQRGKELFAPELGGSYNVFTHTPLGKETIDYCVADVKYMPKMFQRYNRLLDHKVALGEPSDFHTRRIIEATKDRVMLALGPPFQGSAMGPWSDPVDSD
ncbi:MAG: hypothetical protein ASARMPRED_004782 [Alectoria sarmentosa]|nr:MAG: hypothetical protein ASARMPRED_004782 [Alectoria sarmentosa]